MGGLPPRNELGVFPPLLFAGGINGLSSTRLVGVTGGGAPTSGTYLTNDVAFDATGKLWFCTAGGTPGTWTQVGTGGAAVQPAFATLSANYSTSSVTLVSLGVGVSLAPGGTWVEVHGTLWGSNSVAGDGLLYAVYRSTAGVPTQGTAPPGTDTQFFPQNAEIIETAALARGIGLFVLDTGLTAGTTYYYYWAVAAYSGGTATFYSGKLSSLLARAT